MSALIVHADPAPLATWPDGSVRVSGTRLLLDTVVAAFEKGATPAEIVESFPSVGLDAIYGVIGYYLRHRGEVDAYLEARRGGGEIALATLEDGDGSRRLRERLKHRESPS